ncbi:MAG: glycosyltransferase, partial [Lachnospiraceae bacterium]|nr:glycosyltransferase [Lachnospiraceae bacterium]
DELMYKTAYYLSHDEVRQRMAINGYKKVRDQYTYEKQLAKILEKVSETERWEGTLELT